MKGLTGFLSVAALTAVTLASGGVKAATQEVNGVVWTYSVNGGSAIVGGGLGGAAVPASTAGVVAIPSFLGGFPVTGIGSRAFARCSNITTICMPTLAKVESIGASAFEGCTSLGTISFPKEIKSLGTRVFAGCQSLESIKLTAYSGEVLPNGMFEGCTNLRNVFLPAGVTDIASRAFYGCSALEWVDLSSSATVSIGASAFEKCTSLTSVKFGNDLRSIGYGAFFECSGLQTVELPPNVESVGALAFAGCRSLSRFVASEKLSLDEGSVFMRSSEGLFVERYPVSTVIFDLRDGSHNTITRYARIGEPIGPLPKVKREGFVFDGWYSAPERVTTFDGSYPTPEGVAEVEVTEKRVVIDDMLEIYARWLADGKVFVPVAVAAGQEAMGSVSGGNKEIQVGSTVSLKAKANAGAVFAGWYANGELLSTAASYSYRVMDGAAVEARFIVPGDDYLDDIDVLLADEIPLGAAVSAVVTANSGSAVKWTVTGLPPGLKFNASTGAISGKPTKAGVYYIVVKAVNASGYAKTETVKVNVGGVDDGEKDEIGDYFGHGEHKASVRLRGNPVKADGADGYDSFVAALDALDGLVVGDCLDGLEIALPGLSVSGLPKGLSAKSLPGGLVITGMVTTPGAYSMNFTVPHPVQSGKKLTTVKTVIVQDAPSFYLEVVPEDGEMGSVTGSGVYHPGEKVKVSAKAAKRFVFAGWYQDGAEMSCGMSGDWRTATETFLVQSKFGDAPLMARFAESSDDLDQGVVIGDGEEAATWRVSTSGEDEEDDEGGRTVDFTLKLASLSLPKVTVGSLPSGISYSVEDGCIRFAVSDVAKLKPGMKEVSVVAKNQSGATSKMSLLVSVPNIYSEVFEGVLDMSEDGYLLPGGVLMDDIDLLSLTAYGICSSDNPWKVKVSGLPSGMKFDGCDVVGVAKKEGVYTVTFTATRGKETAMATATFQVVFPTLTVTNDTPERGTVTGGGRYYCGQKVTLKATAAKGSVFSAWYLDDGCESDRILSQNPSYAYVTGTEDRTIHAKFIAKADDDICFAEEGDDEWTVDASGCIPCGCDYVAAWEDYVVSGSLPKVTAKGLPAGVKMVASEGLVQLVVSNSGKLKPGVSEVVLTAVNQSGKSATRKMRVIVPNLTCAAISAESDVHAYPLTIGMPINGVFDGIGLSAGYADWTLKASGLPAGLSFKNGVFSGVPTKAGAFTVTLTASKKGASSQTATITVDVAALPEWAVGTFNGRAVSEGDGWKTPLLLTATLSSSGKFSCKLSEPGAGLVSLDCTLTGWDEDGNVSFDVSLKGKGGQGSGSGCISAEGVGDVVAGVLAFELSGSDGNGDAYEMAASARQNLFARKTGIALPAFGKDSTMNVPVELADDVTGSVSRKFGTNGSVTAAWTNPSVGMKASSTCAGVLELTALDEESGTVQAELWTVFKDKSLGLVGVLLELEIPQPAAASKVKAKVLSE